MRFLLGEPCSGKSREDRWGPPGCQGDPLCAGSRTVGGWLRAGVGCPFTPSRTGCLESPVSLLSDKILNLPAVPGVYLFKDPQGRVLYVGKAKRLSQRVRSYLAEDPVDPRHRDLMGE